ncbi:MAG: hypothetical protein WDO56_17025 [Gammaproteobacteria bacterium]
MIRNIASSAVCVVALLLGACSGPKGPATEALSKAESALGAIRDDAARYAPAELQQVESGVAGARDSLAKGDYKAVLASTSGLTSQIGSLQETVAAKKAAALAAADQARTQWAQVSADVPRMLDAVGSRIDTLKQSRSLPKSLSKDSFETAQRNLATMKDNWSQATSLFAQGNASEAVSKAQAAQQSGSEALQLLGMSH